jgi:hypothetical protein
MSKSTMTMLKTLPASALILGVGLFALPACPLLDVSADAQEVCLNYPNLEIPAAPAGQTSLVQSFTFDDLSSVHDLTKLDANLQFVRAVVTATSGIDSFDFIHAVDIVVSSNDPGTTLPPMTMYQCDGDCDPQGDQLEIPAAVGNDAISYLRSNSIKIDLNFQGQPPTVAWTMDVNVCVKAKVSYSVSP